MLPIQAGEKLPICDAFCVFVSDLGLDHLFLGTPQKSLERGRNSAKEFGGGWGNELSHRRLDDWSVFSLVLPLPECLLSRSHQHLSVCLAK